MNIVDLPSPNFDDRGGQPVDMLVMHYTGMKSAQAALDRLRDPSEGKRVSAHYVVDEDGTVYRMVPEDKRAWHAGVSKWRGQENINARSIGIEIVNPGHEFGYRPFPKAQMEAVAALAKDIIARNGIPSWNVVAHSDIAPSRKEDPGELFDWKYLASQGVGIVPDAKRSSPAMQPTPGLFSNPVGWVKKLFFGAETNMVPHSGQSGAHVLELQKNLTRVGYDLDLCSTYGPRNKAAVTAFQRHYRQSKVNGEWDEECQALLGGLLEKLPHASLGAPDGRMAAGR